MAPFERLIGFPDDQTMSSFVLFFLFVKTFGFDLGNLFLTRMYVSLLNATFLIELEKEKALVPTFGPNHRWQRREMFFVGKFSVSLISFQFSHLR